MTNIYIVLVLTSWNSIWISVSDQYKLLEIDNASRTCIDLHIRRMTPLDIGVFSSPHHCTPYISWKRNDQRAWQMTWFLRMIPISHAKVLSVTQGFPVLLPFNVWALTSLLDRVHFSFVEVSHISSKTKTYLILLSNRVTDYVYRTLYEW
jgi:hypothetical protein